MSRNSASSARSPDAYKASPPRPDSDALFKAEELLGGVGARITQGRIRVLTALLQAGRAVSHHEVEAALAPAVAIDRVTVYRVLEWLTSQGLAHKHAGSDRVWRFSAAVNRHDGDHAHFECNVCGKVVCLETTVAPKVQLPAGFEGAEVEVTVKGACAECAHPDR